MHCIWFLWNYQSNGVAVTCTVTRPLIFWVSRSLPVDSKATAHVKIDLCSCKEELVCPHFHLFRDQDFLKSENQNKYFLMVLLKHVYKTSAIAHSTFSAPLLYFSRQHFLLPSIRRILLIFYLSPDRAASGRQGCWVPFILVSQNLTGAWHTGSLWVCAEWEFSEWLVQTGKR